MLEAQYYYPEKCFNRDFLQGVLVVIKIFFYLDTLRNLQKKPIYEQFISLF